MKFAQKYGWLFIVLLIVFQAFYKPPAEYVIRLSPYGVNQLLKAVSASNGIDGTERVQLLREMQNQLIEQDQQWAHQDSLQKKK